MITASTTHTCALTPAGVAYCWGGDNSGALGDGADHAGGFTTVPVPVLGNLRFETISAGNSITCAVTNNGGAYCWGLNDFGAVGVGDSTVSAIDSPAAVSGGLRFRTISTALFHTCALTTGNAAYCWGHNSNGALGRFDPRGIAYSPLPVDGSHTFATIHAGHYEQTCAVDGGGAAYCWGFNGLLGTGDSLLAITVPEAVLGGHAFASVHINQARACGVSVAHIGYCWGDGRQGEVGNDSVGFFLQPDTVNGGISFQDIEPGKNGVFTCGLATDGTTWCWGREAYVLGDTTGVIRWHPALIAGAPRFKLLSVGGYHVCGITDNGDAYCWGQNGAGQLGNGSTTPSSVPVKVTAP